MILQLRCIHPVLVIKSRILVEVGHEDGLAVAWFHMLARASVTVPAGANLVVETTVDLILLCAKDGGEEVRHVEVGRIGA